jgi:hypothetical protein
MLRVTAPRGQAARRAINAGTRGFPVHATSLLPSQLANWSVVRRVFSGGARQVARRDSVEERASSLGRARATGPRGARRTRLRPREIARPSARTHGRPCPPAVPQSGASVGEKRPTRRRAGARRRGVPATQALWRVGDRRAAEARAVAGGGTDGQDHGHLVVERRGPVRTLALHDGAQLRPAASFPLTAPPVGT